MWHNDEIMTSWKNSFVTKEEFEEREVASSASNHEPPFHPYYQSDQLWEEPMVEAVPTFAGKTYKEWKWLYKDSGNRDFYKLLAASYHNLPLGEVTANHISSTHKAWLEWREANSDSN